MKQTANQAHPFTQFSVGNLDTLSDTDNYTILADVKEHYKKTYSAGIMSLVVIGNYSTGQLMQWADSKFSLVPNNGYKLDSNRPAPYLDNQKGVKIEIKTLEDNRQLTLQFEAPSNKAYYNQKPLAYLGHLIGFEGDGSLYQLLKQKGYIKSLNTQSWGPDDFTPISVSIELTPKGYKNIDDIVSNFYSYVDLIKQEGVQERLYNELANIRKTGFKFQDKFDVATLGRIISTNLQYYPAEHALDVGSLYNDFDKELINTYLDTMTPEKMRMIVVAPDIESETKEARYDVPYSMQPLDKSKIAKWNNAPKISALKVPSENPYVATQLDLEKNRSITKPEKVYSEPGLNVWMENENEFGLPKSSLNLRLYTDKAMTSAKSRTILNLHDKIIDDLLSSESYPARVAGLFYGVSGMARGYDITVQGYSEKSNKLLGKIVASLNPDLINQETFNRIKQNYAQELHNKKFARPINQVYGALFEEVYESSFSDKVYLDELSKLDLATFKATVKNLLSEVEAESIYIGNINKSSAKEMMVAVKENLSSKFVDDLKKDVPTIEIAENDLKIRDVAVDHNDSSIGYVIQADTESYTEKAKYRMITQMLSQRFYKSLRTEQQYGYIVSMQPVDLGDTQGLVYAIQSPKAHPSILKSKIDEFMQQQVKHLESISTEEFEAQRAGLISNLDKKIKNTYEKVAQLKNDLVDDNYDFDSKDQLIAEIKKLTPKQMLDFYQSEILSENKRSMVVWNIGKAHTKEASYKASNYNLCSKSKCIIGSSK